jgi:predicted PurR-regulated permease PerM
MTLFFALYQGEKALYHVKKIIPLEEKDKEEIFDTLYHSIRGVIYGTVGTAVLQAFTALGLYIYYGLSYPFLWAIATAFFAFIPPFGTAYIWLPVTIYVMVKVNLTKGLIGLIYGVLIIASVDNIVRPLLMKEKIELPYIFLFFSVMGGLFVFGFTGLFLGPTIFALFITLIKIYERKFA